MVIIRLPIFRLGIDVSGDWLNHYFMRSIEYHSHAAVIDDLYVSNLTYLPCSQSSLHCISMGDESKGLLQPM